MTQPDNIQIVRHIFEAWNKHDPDRYVKFLDEKHVVESDTLPAPLTGREAGRQFMQMYVSAFPDLHFDIDQIFGEGDYVTTRWTATGTQRGELGHQADESAHRDPRLLGRPAQERQSRA
jgi:predicted ester cyclase